MARGKAEGGDGAVVGVPPRGVGQLRRAPRQRMAVAEPGLFGAGAQPEEAAAVDLANADEGTQHHRRIPLFEGARVPTGRAQVSCGLLAPVGTYLWISELAYGPFTSSPMWKCHSATDCWRFHVSHL